MSSAPPTALPLQERYDALAESHNRLRTAAQAIIDAADYPADGGDARVYRHQLADLRRELEGTPQPSARLHWMSTS